MDTSRDSKKEFHNKKAVILLFLLGILLLGGSLGFFFASLYSRLNPKPSVILTNIKDENISPQTNNEEGDTPQGEVDPEQKLLWTKTEALPNLAVFNDQYFMSAKYFQVGIFQAGKYGSGKLINALTEEGGMGENTLMAFFLIDTPEKFILLGKYSSALLPEALNLANKPVSIDSEYVISVLEPINPSINVLAQNNVEAQKVAWQTPVEMTELHDNLLFQQPRAWYKVGTIQEGYYKNFDVIVTTPRIFFLDHPSVARFLKKGDEWIFLSQQSALPQADFWIALRYKEDANFMLFELAFPQRLEANGMELQFEYNWLNTDRFTMTFPEGKSFDEEKYTKTFTHPSLGSVFIPRGDDNDGRLVAYLPDGTELVYSLIIPFTTETNIPAVTWTNGTKNEEEYLYQRVGGCGQKDYANIVPASELNFDKDLTPSGKTSTGDPIFTLLNARHNIIEKLFDEYESFLQSYHQGFDETQQPPKTLSYEQFIAERPVFFWKDPFNRVIEFKKNIFVSTAECGKPVIYLYPQETTQIHVTVEPKGGMSYSDPLYVNGWNVIAEPNGTLTEVNSKKTYPYLFWEGRGKRYEQPKRGWVIHKEAVESFLGEKLSLLGLNSHEQKDFLEFWLPRMQETPYYFVTFLGKREMDIIAPLTVIPKPDTVIRILMDFSPLLWPISVEPLNIHTPKRRGFTVVEWGGVIQSQLPQEKMLK